MSQVLDALLQDPLWKDRIASDSKGPRVGAIGHSAGGYTVLALAGGQHDMSRLASHCSSQRAEDPIFCSLAGTAPADVTARAFESVPAVPSVRDTRIRAVVALSPAGAMFTPSSLARISVPTLLYRAEADRFMVPRFHVDW